MSIANQRAFARIMLVLVDTTLSSRIQMMNTVPRRMKKKNSSCGKTNPTSARARRRPRGCSTSFSHDNASHWQRRVTCCANLNVAATEIQFEVSFSYSQEPNQSHASWAVVSSFISSVKLHAISTSSVKSHSTRQHSISTSSVNLHSTRQTFLNTTL